MSLIALLVGLIVVIIVCSLIWWGIPILLPDTVSPRNKQRIAILCCIIVILIWLSGGFGGFSAPWGFYGHHR